MFNKREDSEPILIKKEKFDLSFFKKNIYLVVLGLILLLGTSFSLTFFIQNKKIGEITLTVGDITYTVTQDKSISINNLEMNVPNSEGLFGYSKEITIRNTSDINGELELKINRTSGVPLEGLRYGLYINDVLIDVSDMPSDGVIYHSAILGNEEIKAKVVLWLKEDYSTNETTFVGDIEENITLDSLLASTYLNSLDNLNNNYVKFNGNETWRIKGVEDGSIVVTKTEYLNNTFTNSNLFNVSNTLTDDSLVVSMSTDNKAYYLKKTVKIVGGSGTESDPYILENDIDDINDRKIVGYITYNNEGTNLTPRQPIYHGETNYIGMKVDDTAFQGWSDGTNTYDLGDSVTFNSDTTLNALLQMSYYEKMRRTAIIDNINSEFVNNTPAGINFTNTSSNTNGKGLYMRAGTENDEYPILYYRGDIQNNNVLFNGFCWQIVRTTSTGGIKMVYNGIAENDQCLTSRTAPTGVTTGTSRSNQTLGNANNTLNYYYGTNYTYDTTTNKFTLAGTVSNAKQWNDTNYPDLLGKYTCKATTADATCSPLYFIDDYQSATQASTTQITLAATGHYSQLGKSAFNSSNASPSYNGYMYGTVYPYSSSITLSKTQSFTTTVTSILSSVSVSTSYYYADSFEWNTEVANKYTLVNSTQVTSDLDKTTLIGKYLLSGASNTTVYYVSGINGNTAYTLNLTDAGTHDLAYFNNATYTYGDTLTDLGNGSYQISNADSSITDTIEKKDYAKPDNNSVFNYTIGKTREGLVLGDTTTVTKLDIALHNSNYTEYKYTCNDTNSTCTESNLRYIIGFTATGYNYAPNHYFGTSLGQNGNNYVLQNTIDLENSNNLTNLATHHYVCVNIGLKECAQVAYIYYYTGSGSAYYILLKDVNMTKSVDDALSEMQTNSKDSTIKGIIDNWYYNNLLRVESYLEDTIYCNDRSTNTIGNQSYINNGWIANGGNTSNYLYYGSYGRQNNTPNLGCINKNDAFTVSDTTNGNGALTYPIGLLTVDEINLAGRGSSYYLYNNTYYWSLAPYYFNNSFALGFRVRNGLIGNDFVYSAGGVRPAISLRLGTMLGEGDGSYGSPLKIVN